VKLLQFMWGLGIAALLLARCSGVPPVPVPGDTRTRPTDGAIMIYVPGGEFQMGSTDDEVDDTLRLCHKTWGNCQREWFADQAPIHTVVLDAFWMDRTEVTNKQYTQCVLDNRCAASRCADDYRHAGADYPVVCVSWEDAQTYCAWAGARLPTEAEWEYAARGSERRVYPWGETFDCARGNFDDETEINAHVVSGKAGCDGYVRPAPVGSFPEGASWCQVQDLAGNVWEWVSDWYGAYPPERQANPKGPEDGREKVLRGGSWNNREHTLRSAFREGETPSYTYVIFGFRCAMAHTADR
jgi:formylglycine-generating enzyme required for sulfatase activity